MPSWRGSFRVRGQNGRANRAWITDGDNGEWKDEAAYKATSISPLWEDLPWAGEDN